MERNIARCEAIIENLLDYARTRELTKVLTDIDDWLCITAEDLDSPSSTAVSLQLRSGVYLAVDRERLHQVTVNVLQNSLQENEASNVNGDAGKVFIGSAATD
jgi:signal transduction histidine kinase